MTDEMTPDRPLAERVKWLLGKGVSLLQAGTIQEKASGNSYHAIYFYCHQCPDIHVVEEFPSEAEADAALTAAFRECGIEVHQGGVVQEGGNA